jgi:hypothetical protein
MASRLEKHRAPTGSQASSMSGPQLRDRLRDRGCLRAEPPPPWMRTELKLQLARWGAFGAFLGHKQTGGRWTSEPSLVVVTSIKHDPGRARGGVRRIPVHVRWHDRSLRHQLATDVQQVPAKLMLHFGNVFGPGDAAEYQGDRASIGAAVVHPRFGACLTTAGHLFGRAPSNIDAHIVSDGTRVSARVVGVQERGVLDYALLAPRRGVACDNLFRNAMRIGPAYTPTLLDVGKRVYLLDGSGTATRTTCRGVGGQFFTTAGTYANTIQTDAVSQPSQSGGALVDDAQRLWGFLLGSLGSRYSLFAPAQLILDEAGVQLFQG